MNRTLMLCHALGWQGGTIHQVAEETGCEVNEVLYTELPHEEAEYEYTDDDLDYEYGQYVIAHKDDSGKKEAFEDFKGNVYFWLGVAEGQRIKESQ